MVKPEKSHFVPAQRVQYLDTVLVAQTFGASPSRERIDKLKSLGDEILSSRLQPCPPGWLFWGDCPISNLVPWGRLRTRALQLALHRLWDRLDDSFLVYWSDDCLQVLL